MQNLESCAKVSADKRGLTDFVHIVYACTKAKNWITPPLPLCISSNTERAIIIIHPEDLSLNEIDPIRLEMQQFSLSAVHICVGHHTLFDYLCTRTTG